jgi:hypothetical protein
MVYRDLLKVDVDTLAGRRSDHTPFDRLKPVATGADGEVCGEFFARTPCAC